LNIEVIVMEKSEKILVSLPAPLVARMRAAIPARQRSKVFRMLIEQELEKREEALYQCALAVEKDSALNKEMEEWDSTLNDGLNDESW